MKPLALFAALLAGCAASPKASESAAPETAGDQCIPAEPWPTIPSTAPPNSTYTAHGKAIPQRYRSAPAGWVKISFMSAGDVNRECAGGMPICNRTFYACVRGNELIMPNPCDEPLAPSGEGYVGTLCHEIAHVNGWPETHGD